ncbi:MAG: chemotaxis protein CheB [Bacteroidia bacterium]
MNSLNLVIIGFSAGGLIELKKIFSNLPLLKKTVFVIAYHTSPNYKSLLPQLLSKNSFYIFKEAEDDEVLTEGYVYVVPSNLLINITKNTFKLDSNSNFLEVKPNIDYLLKSIDVQYYNSVIGVVLSGAGKDSVEGLKHIKANGGYVLVQKPETAKFNSMPKSVIENNLADYIIESEKIAFVIEKLIDKVYIYDDKANTTLIEKIFIELEKYLKINLVEYYNKELFELKLNKYLEKLKVNSLNDYLLLLKNNENELKNLYYILFEPSNKFITDSDFLTTIKSYLLKIILNKQENEELRIWIPFAGFSKNVIQLIIIIDELLKKYNKKLTVKIFATDLNEEILQNGRTKIFTKIELENLFNEQQLKNYFDNQDDLYKLKYKYRLMIMFNKHDLLSMPPFLKIDLILTKNIFLYFNNSASNKLVQIFHYSGIENCILIIDDININPKLFEPYFKTLDNLNNFFGRNNAIKRKIFEYKNIDDKNSNDISLNDLIKNTIYNSYENPFLVINNNNQLLDIRGEFNDFLIISNGYFNLNIQNILNPDVYIEAKIALTQSKLIHDVYKSNYRKYNIGEKSYIIRFIVKPIFYNFKDEEIYILIFDILKVNADLKEIFKLLNNDIGDIKNNEIEVLKEELEVTRHNLQNYIEELEVTNEELQNLNEELQTVNEQLSANSEELKASNESLKSTSEELNQTYNELLKRNEIITAKELELRQAYARLESLINSGNDGIIFIDNEFNTILYNSNFEKIIYSLTGNKISVNSSYFDILDDNTRSKITKYVKLCLKTGNEYFEIIKYKINEEAIYYKIIVTSVLINKEVFGFSVKFQDITKDVIEENKIRFFETAFKNISEAVIITNSITKNQKLEIIYANNKFLSLTGYTIDEVVGKSPEILNGEETDKNEILKIFDALNNKKSISLKLLNYKKNNETFWNDISISPVFNDNGELINWVAIYKDITDEIIIKKQKELLIKIREIFDDIEKNTDEMLSMVLDFLIKETRFEMAELWKVNNNNEINLYNYLTYNHLIFNSFYSTDKTIKTFKKGDGIPGYVWNNNKSIFIYNVDESPFFARKEQAKKCGLNTVFAFPLTYNNIVKGVVILASTKVLKENYINKYLNEIRETLGAEFERLISKEEVTRFMNVSPDIMCIAGYDGYFKKVNPAMCNLLGYSVKELTSKPIVDFVYKPDLEKTQKEIEKIVNTGTLTINFQNRYLTKNGELIWLSWSTIMFPSESLIYSLAKNITEEKRAEEMINRSGNLAKLGSMEYKIDSQKIYLSDIGYEILELPTEIDLNINEFEKLVTNDVKEKLIIKIDNVLNNLKSEIDEILINTTLGKTKWLRIIAEPQVINDKCVSIYISFQDITEEKINQIKLNDTLNLLNKANDRFIKVTQATNDAIWDWDLEKNTFFKSDVYEEKFGKTVNDMDESNNYDWRYRIHPDDLKMVENSLNNALNNPKEYEWSCQYRFLKKDKTYAYIQDKAVIVRDKNDKAIRIVGAMADITNMKKQIDAIKEQNKKLHEIAYTQSHVLRAPVSRIMGLNILLQDKDTSAEDKQKCIEYIDKSCKELDKTILNIVLKTHELDEITKDFNDNENQF